MKAILRCSAAAVLMTGVLVLALSFLPGQAAKATTAQTERNVARLVAQPPTSPTVTAQAATAQFQSIATAQAISATETVIAQTRVATETATARAQFAATTAAQAQFTETAIVQTKAAQETGTAQAKTVASTATAQAGIAASAAAPTPIPTPSTTLVPTPTQPSTASTLFSGNNLIFLIIAGIVLLLLLVLVVFALSRGGRKKQAAKSDKKPKKPKPPTKVIAPPPLETTAPCPKCGNLNRASAKFCKTCGTTLAGAAAAMTLPKATKKLDASTAPVTVEVAPLAALAVQATIGPNRYRIVEVVHTSKQLNRYVAEDLQPRLHCAKCGQENPAESRFCEECGTSLAGVVTYAPRYRVKEAANVERFRTEYELAQSGVSHPQIIPPRASFEEEQNGQLRYYVVLDELTWGTAAQIMGPQDLPTLLEWGSGLADGLSYLHQQHVVMNRLSGGEIALIGKVARWSDFETARLVPLEEWQATGTQLIVANVRQLAELLYRLATGQTQFDPTNRALAPKANAVFAKALSETGYLTALELGEALRQAEANLRRPGGIDVHVARLSDVGQERDLDEDSILTLELGQVYRSSSAPLGLYAVADGMGGHEGGDVASRLAIRAIARRAVNDILTPALLENAVPLDYEKWIKEAVLEANQTVLTQRKASRNDMGTTLVLALIDHEAAIIAHVGDSRAYLIRAGTIKPLTTDHSLVERLIATKQITRAEAATHPQRNVIYKNIGDKAQVEPDISRHALQPGDRLLLCCDGLSGEVGDEAMLRIVSQAPALPEACRQLVRAANEAGGHDNISVVLVEVIAID
jgi:PPM family protein phosphatase